MESRFTELSLESRGIPFEDVLEPIQVMKYGCPERCMYEMLFLTGCRVKELDNMKRSQLFNDKLYWHVGKNQKGYRCATIPKFFMDELIHLWTHYRAYGDRFFSMTADSFFRRFNSHVRPKLGLKWQQTLPSFRGGSFSTEHVYSLKGLRKDFATLEFARQRERWGDMVAVDMTCKSMKHSSTHMTATHYLVNYDKLNIHKYKHLTTAQIMQTQAQQTRILDFL